VLPHGGHAARATIKCRTKDANGNLIGKRHTTPFLNSRMYDAVFNNGDVESFTI
jgi:hypothetical protein